jgi:hypothetical protein
MEYTFCFAVYGSFSTVDLSLGHKVSHNEEKIEITYWILSHNDGIK